MSQIIRRESPTARGKHRCSFCQCDIEQGERYCNDTMSDGGELYTWKSHNECSALASRMMTEHYLEEISTGEFQDGVFEDYRERFNDDNISVLEKVRLLLSQSEGGGDDC